MTTELKKKLPLLSVVSHTMPGDCNGQAIVLDRLAIAITESGMARWQLINTRPKWKQTKQPHFDGSLVHASMPYWLRRLKRFRTCQNWLFRKIVQNRANKIAAACRQAGSTAIIGCTGGDLVDPPASIRAGELTGLPVFLYYFDDYATQSQATGCGWSRSVLEEIQKETEPELLRRASGIIAPNETLAEDLSRRCTTPLCVVRNAVDLNRFRSPTVGFAGSRVGECSIFHVAYTGSIYSAQVDSIERLAKAISQLQTRGVYAELHLYSPAVEPAIRQRLSNHSVHWHSKASSEAVAQIQSEAHVLYLPLSFDCAYPELIRTSAPGKFGEYLASGTPLLIHAPSDSFPVTFAEKHQCAATCSIPTVDSLSQVLIDLLSKPERQKKISKAATDISADFCQRLNAQRLVDFAAFDLMVSKPESS